MPEQLIGITFSWFIITVFDYIVFSKIAYKLRISDLNDEYLCTSYACNMIIFLVISSLILLFPAVYYNCISSKLPKSFEKSGIIFSFFLVLMGIIIRLLYKGFFWIINKAAKSKPFHKLTSSEISWTWLMICLIYGVWWIKKETVIACSYFGIVISYFFWLDASCSSVKEKLSTIKELTKSYWYIVIFVVLTIFITWRYSDSEIQTAFAIIGLFLGITICVLGMHYLKRHYNKKRD